MIRYFLTFVLAVLSVYAQTAQYPAAVATDSHLKKAINNLQTTLRGRIAAGDTLITVADASLITANTLLTIEREIVSVSSKSGNDLTVVRGFDGTTATAHNSGRTVSAFVDAWHFEALKKEVQAIQSTLGTNLSNIGPGMAPAATYPSEQIQDWPHAGQDDIFVNYLFRSPDNNPVGRQVIGSFITGTQETQDSYTWAGGGDKVGLYAGASTAKGASTTLTAGVGAADLVIPVVSNAMVSTATSLYPHLAKIETEWVRVCGVTGSTIINVCTGGRGITVTAASHSNGATVTSLAPVFAANFLLQKMPAPVDDVNSHALEIDVNNYAGDYTGAAGQGSSVGLLVTMGTSDVASHGILLRGDWYCPLCVEVDSKKGIFVSPSSAPLDYGPIQSAITAKQMFTGGSIYTGYLLDATGRFFDLIGTNGVDRVAILDYAGNFITNGYIENNVYIKSTGYFTTEGAQPYYKWVEGGVSADEGKWRMVADAESLQILAYNDAEDAADGAISITRTGATVAGVTIKKPTFSSVPTSCSGLGTGALWNDSGTAKLCP